MTFCSFSFSPRFIHHIHSTRRRSRRMNVTSSLPRRSGIAILRKLLHLPARRFFGQRRLIEV
jgi:hypothetical protein